MTHSSTHFDVAIIGGGPAGSTAGALMKKYAPETSVLILEKEKFPRDHVGESQLPPISAILHEMGCWDKVEAANFPIKVGATYRWGKSPELWDFEFLPLKDFKDEARPAKYEGQRVQTAFQVDRAIYDKILLDHAGELGVDVREETQVRKIGVDGDRVTGFTLGDGTEITADHYVDASGHVGIMRKALGVECDAPTRLQNIAMWDYWENAEWAVEIGTGGTRVQVLSISDGWIWFIPLGPTRTSIGYICPAEHYKKQGKSVEEIYKDALSREHRVQKLIKNATPRGEVEATKDWSFTADRLVGENWFLTGECAGFADPILAAGMTLAHTGARELAYTINALKSGEHDPAWLKTHYEHNQLSRVRQHIRFADYWYASNGVFTDLKEHSAAIAKDAGLRMNPDAAFRWLAQGGFANDAIGQVGIGGLDVAGAKQITGMFSDRKVKWQVSEYNVFKLNLDGAERTTLPTFEDGRIKAIDCYVRGERKLPLTGTFGALVEILEQYSDASHILQALTASMSKQFADPGHARVAIHHSIQTLEVMLSDGWVFGQRVKGKARLNIETPETGTTIHPNEEAATAAS
jgi:flavin-dependent dehydrogenase